MNKIKSTKGITLIALVITIIILLILAGVTINIVFNDGIAEKAQTAVDTYKISEYKEKINLIITQEKFKKISDRTIDKTLKELVLENLDSEENKTWVKAVETIEENQIKIITQDKYIIIIEIGNDGNVTYLAIEKDNGEPYPSVEAEVLALEGKENEKVKIKVNAEVEKIKKTKKIAKIELILEDVVKQTKEYNELEVQDIFEVEENGTYKVKVTTDQGKSTTKKVIVNIQGTENKIGIDIEPKTPRNTENTGTKNGVEQGPIKVTIEYGETELKKLYTLDGENWIEVEETGVEIDVTENIEIIAKYSDGKNSFKVESYNIENVDNVAPTFSSYDATLSGTTITATHTEADAASEGAASGTEGVKGYEYRINNGAWQKSNTFTISSAGDYTVYIKAIDNAGNETIVNKQVTANIYTVNFDANRGKGAPSSQTVEKGTSITISSTEPTRKYYTFKGWSTSNTDDTTAEYSVGESLVVDKNITLYAVWERENLIYAKLYGDGTLAFSSNNDRIEGKNLINAYKEIGLLKVDYPTQIPWFNDRTNIKSVTFVNEVKPISTAFYFNGCSNLTTINNIQNLNTSNVTNMLWMFQGCGSLESLNLSDKFNTSNVKDMKSMFSGCSSLKSLDLSNFDTSNVTNMNAMFCGCNNLTSLDVSNFNTSNVTDMSSMFSGCGSLESLNLSGKFNTSNVTNMNAMFRGCGSLESLNLSGKFNTSNVTNMSLMFKECGSLTSLDLSNFDTSNVTRMNNMFCDCSKLTTIHVDSSNWKTDGADTTGMFSGCKAKSVTYI